jgi:hypothetical protein
MYEYQSISVNVRIVTGLELGTYSGKIIVFTTYHCTEVPNLASPVSGSEVSER